MSYEPWNHPSIQHNAVNPCATCGVEVADGDQTFCETCKPLMQHRAVELVRQAFDPGDALYDMTEVFEMRKNLSDWVSDRRTRGVALSLAVRR